MPTSPVPTSTSTCAASRSTASSPSSRWPRCATAPASHAGEDKARPARLRPVEGRQAGRAILGQPLGAGTAGLAHRVLGHEHEVPGRRVRHPRRAAATSSSLITRTRSPRRRRARRAFRALLDAQRDAEPERARRCPRAWGTSSRCGRSLDGHRPEALVAVFLGSHYRSPMEFSRDVLEEAEQQVDRLRNLFRALADRAAAVRGGAPGGGQPRLVRGRSTLRGPARAAGLRRGHGRRPEHRRRPGRGLRAGPRGQRRPGGREVDARRRRDVRTEMAEMVHVLGLDAVTGSEDDVPADVVAMAESDALPRGRDSAGRTACAPPSRSAATRCGTRPVATSWCPRSRAAQWRARRRERRGSAVRRQALSGHPQEQPAPPASPGDQARSAAGSLHGRP